MFKHTKILVKTHFQGHIKSENFDKLKFVNLTTQTSQADKFWPVFDDPTTRKILRASHPC